MASLELTAYLDRSAGLGWVWGEDDCALWIAAWGRVLTGKDGGAQWRGRYHTRLGCLRLLKREGGLSSVVERGAVTVGMSPVADPVEGDIGIVPVESPRGPDVAAGIYTGDGFWAMRAPAGVVLIRATPTHIWGLR